MEETQTKQRDPKQAGAQPPFPEQDQTFPGSDDAMRPKADHGEKTYKGSGKLEGKKALITGADSGIGRAVALAFAREGADVVVSYLSEDRDAQETARLVEEAGHKAVRVCGDIQDHGHCKDLIDQSFRDLGGLDILVNNAAFQMAREDITDITPEEFESTYQTNVFAMFYLCQAALPRMPKGSSIINTASIQSFDPSPALLAYASTKSAIVGFTKALAKMAMERGIRVNAVAPGPVWTPLIPSTMPEDLIAQFGKGTVFGRPAQPAELAPLYVLLASNEASYVTGETYGATGGSMPL